MTDGIKPRLIENEMKESYIDYAMSVIVGRALPDVRDGLKPVHRRVLFTMQELSLQHNKAFKKCARIVGDCLGRYHPHGDSSVYFTLVRMAQDFSLRYPLVNGQGNFGSIDGDSAAAMRYCITGDSLLLTNKGIMPISSISKRKEQKINLNILSYNGSENKAIKFFNSGKHKIIEIETSQGYSLRGSYNHPVLCWTKGFLGKPKLEWKLLEHIGKEEIVILQRNYGLFSNKNLDLKKFIPKNKRYKKINLPKKMNKDLAFLLGALVAEGSFHQDKIIFNNKDEEFYNKIRKIILSQFKGIQLYERDISGNCKELEIYHQRAVQFLINIGLKNVKSIDKQVPFSILKSKKEIIKTFLQALFEGDGSVSFKKDKRHKGKSIEINYNSKSKRLVQELKILLLNFGITSNNYYLDKRNNCYKLSLSSQFSAQLFHQKINFFSKKKKDILKKVEELNAFRLSKLDSIPYLSEYLRNKYKNSFLTRNNIDRYPLLEKNYKKLIEIIDLEDKALIDSLLKYRYLFNNIVKFKKTKKKETVYSIKVDSNCHSFIANGFINHNTEAKMEKIAEEMLVDIDKETVDFVPNFDGSMKEPTVLPSRIPNLLINGSTGIAVGMATNIPPHNILEIADATLLLLDNPETSILDLCETVKGPDFPTGGIICGTAGIRAAYKNGRGKIKVRAKAEIEETPKKNRIILTEIPYMVNKSSLIEQIAHHVNEKMITGISDIRDESDRKGIRVVIELKKDINPEVVLNQLYKRTAMQTTFGMNMLALHNNQPKVMGLKDLISYFIEHRKDVIIRRSKYELRKAEERAHILEGLKIALQNIEEVVQLIKKSASAQDAKIILTKSYELTEVQAQAILDMKLQKLTSLEQDKLNNEIKSLIKQIEDLKEILESEQRVIDIIKEDLLEIKQKYGDDRRTEILEVHEDIETEDLIPEEDVVITSTYSGYIKKLPLEEYKQQKRGGYGVTGAKTKEEDVVEHLITCSTHATILCFSNKGKVYWLRGFQIPTGSKYSKGKAIINLLRLDKDERINTMIPLKEFHDKHYLIMVTKKGLIKKTELDAYSNPRKGGIIAIKLMPNDELVQVRLTPGHLKFIVGSKKGQAVRFDEQDVRAMGRNAAGVRAIKLGKGDEVIGLEVAVETATLLTVTENGYGKRSPITDYRLTRRGGKGVINIKTSSRNGNVIGIKTVMDHDEIILITKNGIVIRMSVSDVSVIGRNTQGVRIMKLRENDKVRTVARIISNED